MSNSQHRPFVSVIICLYNGADVVGRAIESILRQDYPANRFEVIVVEDGSTDNSFDVASAYPVRVIRHARNLGVAAARSTGLEQATGEIYVGFDDDCIVPPNWLSELVKGYEQPNVRGVGSLIVPPAKVRGLADRFMAASGSGNPAPLRPSGGTSLARRFWTYLVNQGGAASGSAPRKTYAVYELYGASASFPIEVLKRVGGWDTSLRWMEDIDICARIRQTYPDHHFYVSPGAKITHDPKMSLATFIRRPFSRGAANYHYYRGLGITPPIFPFPLLWLAAIAAGLMAGPIWGIVTAIAAPQLLYGWWVLYALRQRSLPALAFAYLQLADELSTVAGIIRGYLVFRLKRAD